MAGYMIVNNEVTDEAKYAEFRERIASAVEGAGGKYLVRGGTREVMEGDWNPDRVVVVEFADVDSAKAFLNSSEYQELKDIRLQSGQSQRGRRRRRVIAICLERPAYWKVYFPHGRDRPRGFR